MIKPTESRNLWVAFRMIYTAILLFYYMRDSNNIKHDPKRLFNKWAFDSEKFLIAVGKHVPDDKMFEEPISEEKCIAVSNVLYEMSEMTEAEIAEVEEMIVNYRRKKYPNGRSNGQHGQQGSTESNGERTVVGNG